MLCSFYHHLCIYTVSKTFTCPTQCNVVAKSFTDSGVTPTPLLHNVKLMNSASAQIYSCLFCAFMFTRALTALSKRNLILTFTAVLTWHQNLLLRQFAGGWGCHTDTSRAWSDSKQELQKTKIFGLNEFGWEEKVLLAFKHMNPHMFHGDWGVGRP